MGNLATTIGFGGNYIDTFVHEMNRLAKKVLHLKNTRYTNPHGLSDR